MRTAEEQIQGLALVAARAPNASLILTPGDVPALRVDDREIVYADGSYDLWVEGHLAAVDLTAAGAAKALGGELR